MYEYKVLVIGVNQCEKVLNEAAKEGWRLAQMVPNHAAGIGMVVTLERMAEK